MHSFPISSDDSSRFSTITSRNHAGYLWIVTILVTIYTILSFLLRAYVKCRMYGWDDLILALATLVYLAQAVSVFDGLSNGLATVDKSVRSNGSIIKAGHAFLTSEVLALMCLCLAKCSVLAMMARLWTRTVDFKRWAACFSLVILSLVWGLGSALGVAVNCNSSTMLRPHGNLEQCPNQYLRWRAITAVDIVTDIILCILPPVLTWPLQMPMGWKAQVTVAFGFRILVIPASVLHLSYLKSYPTSDEPQFAVTRCLIFQQVMLALSLISATIPNLKAFMKSFYWGIGFADMENATASTSLEVRYELQTIGCRPTRRRNLDRQEDATVVNRSNGGGGGGNLPHSGHVMLRLDAVKQRVSITRLFAGDKSVATNASTLDKIGSREMMIGK